MSFIRYWMHRVSPREARGSRYACFPARRSAGEGRVSWDEGAKTTRRAGFGGHRRFLSFFLFFSTSTQRPQLTSLASSLSRCPPPAKQNKTGAHHHVVVHHRRHRPCDPARGPPHARCRDARLEEAASVGGTASREGRGGRGGSGSGTEIDVLVSRSRSSKTLLISTMKARRGAQILGEGKRGRARGLVVSLLSLCRVSRFPPPCEKSHKTQFA